jgi:hypothetical protein
MRGIKIFGGYQNFCETIVAALLSALFNSNKGQGEGRSILFLVARQRREVLPNKHEKNLKAFFSINTANTF